MPCRALLLLLAFCCAAFGCSRAAGPASGSLPDAKPMELTPVVDGLLPQHRGEAPIVEKVSCPPRSDCLTSRVYRDGTLYYLVDAGGTEPSKRWRMIARITPQGVESLEKLYASLCGKVDPVLGNDAGSELHRVTVPGCTQEFVVTGIPSGGLARIGEANDIINRSVIPGSAPAAPTAP
jgi:hypothetical protein